MDQELGKAIQMGVRADGAQLRMTAMILHALVEQGVLPESTAKAIVKQARDTLPENDPFLPAYDEVLSEFR